jgi:hypothetical protein
MTSTMSHSNLVVGPRAGIARSLVGAASTAILAIACGGGEFSPEARQPDAGAGGFGGTSSGGSATGGSATGGSATGGSSGLGGGGNAGSGGSGGSGGAGGMGGISGGSGGAGGSTAGAGGSTSECVVGAVECDADPPRRCDESARWQQTVCSALLIADITALDAVGLPGFNVGFRCKALSVCGMEQNCVYYGEHLGSLQSGEELFYDGLARPAPSPAFVRIYQGAASQCDDPAITLTAGENLVVFHDGTKHAIYFPATTVSAVTLFIREDGATFYDASLTQPAGAPR